MKYFSVLFFIPGLNASFSFAPFAAWRLPWKLICQAVESWLQPRSNWALQGPSLRRLTWLGSALNREYGCLAEICLFARSADEDSGGALLFLLRAPALHHQVECCIHRERCRTRPLNAASLRNICLTHTVACRHDTLAIAGEERVSDSDRYLRQRHRWDVSNMSFLFGVRFIISKCMRRTSGWVFIIHKRSPDPRLMSGQSHLSNSTSYFYDLQHVGHGSSKGPRLKVGCLCERKEKPCFLLKQTHIP